MNGWTIFAFAVVATVVFVRAAEVLGDWIVKKLAVEDDEEWWFHDCPEEGPSYLTAHGEECSYCGAKENAAQTV